MPAFVAPLAGYFSGRIGARPILVVGPRPDVAGARLARGHRDADRPVHRLRAAVHRQRHRHGHVLRADRQPRPVRRSAGGGGQGVGREQRHPRGRRRVRGRRAGVRVLGQRLVREPAGLRRRHGPGRVAGGRGRRRGGGRRTRHPALGGVGRAAQRRRAAAARGGSPAARPADPSPLPGRRQGTSPPAASLLSGTPCDPTDYTYTHAYHNSHRTKVTMWPCRTRPSTSPMETSSSTSGPRSSPAATSPRRSPARSSATSTSRRASARASTTSSSAWASAPGARSGSPAILVGEWVDSQRPSAPTTTASGAAARASTSSTSSAQPEWWAVDAEGKPAGWRGYLGIGDVRYGSRAQGVDPRGRRDPRRAPRQGSARALRHGRALRAPADRGGARHLSPAPPGAGPGRCAMTAQTQRPRPAPPRSPRPRRRPPSRSAASASRTASRSSSTASTSTSPRAPCSRCSGPNGAGKTTAIHILSTLISADAGEVRVGGFDVAARAERRPRPDRPDRPGLGGRRPVHGRGEPAPDGRPLPPRQGARAGGGSRSCSSGSTSSTPPTSPR